MISREEAVNRLKRFWQVSELNFLARFKKIDVPGKSVHGYFEPFTEDYPNLRYPAMENATYRRNVSLYQAAAESLVDGGIYRVEMELQEDRYRQKAHNPFLLGLKKYHVYSEQQEEKNASIDVLTKTIDAVSKEFLDLDSPYLVVTQANSVELLSTDIYSENIRFIYELIQNADDAALGAETEVDIQIVNNYVIVSHHGKPFTPRDIRGLCSVGFGVKSNDITKTGYKGIGFKSVFGQPAGLVYVKSEDVLFKFDKHHIANTAWKEKWGDKENWEREYEAKFNAPWQIIPILCKQTEDHLVNKILHQQDYAVSTVIQIPKPELLYRDLLTLFKDARVLLFLRRVSKISLRFNDDIVSIYKQSQVGSRLVKVYKNDAIVDTYYVYKRTIDIPNGTQDLLKQDIKTPKKIQNMVKAEFSIAVCLDKSNEKIRLLSKQEAPIYSFLPTSDVDYELPYLVNANFILDASRQKLDKDHVWNQFLFNVIGNQVVELCSELAENRLYLDNYLSLLKKGFYDRTEVLFQKYNSGLRKGLRDIPFIINQNEELVHIHDICIDDFNLLVSSITEPSQIISFLNKSFNTKFQIENFFQENKNLRDLDGLGLIHLSNYTDFLKIFLLSSEFRSGIHLENNVKVLDFLRIQDVNDHSKSWNVSILHTEFILNSSGVLSKIYNICYPENLFEQDTDFTNEVIHEAIYTEILENKTLKLWLDELGVTAPSSIAYLDKEILHKLPDSVNESNYITIFKFIVRLHKNSQLSSVHYENLQSLPLNTSDGFVSANECVLSEKFQPKFSFEKFQKVKNLIVEEYITHIPEDLDTIKSFFQKVNVIEDIEFQTNLMVLASRLPKSYTEEVYREAKVEHVYPHLIGFDYARNSKPLFFMQNFSFIESVYGAKEWKLFWEYLIKKYSVSLNNTLEKSADYSTKKFINSVFSIGRNTLDTYCQMTWGRMKSNRMLAKNFFFWFLERNPVIPTQGGDLKLSKSVLANTEQNIELVGSYVPVLDLSTPISKGWAELLGLKKELSNNELFQVLTSISKDLYVGKRLKRENIARVGLIYNLLIERLSNPSEKADITKIANNWLLSNQLVADDLSYQEAQHLVYVKLKDFKINEDKIKTILIPKNVKSDQSGFYDLLAILKVKIVEELTYDAQQEIEELKVKLFVLDLIPFVASQLYNKLLIINISKYVSEVVDIVKRFSFKSCTQINANLIIEGNIIAGPLVKYYYNLKDSVYLSTINFHSPVFRLSFSEGLSSILKASSVKQELLFGLSLDNYDRRQIVEESIDDKDLFTSFYENQDYLVARKEIEDLIGINTRVVEIKALEKSKASLSNVAGEVDEKEVNYTETKEKYKVYFESEVELSEYNNLFNLSLSKDDIADWSLVAIFRAIKYYEEAGYDLRNDLTDIDLLTKRKYFTAYKDGEEIIVYPRSARQNLLFVSINAWEALGDKQSYIFVVTDKCGHKIIDSKQELLDGDNSLIFKLTANNLEDRVKLVDQVLQEQNINNIKYSYVENIVLIVRMDSSEDEFDSIFNTGIAF